VNCEKCQKKVATVHLTEIVDDVKREVNLCAECAAEQGLVVPAAGGMEVLSGLVGEHVGKELAAMAGLRCPACGHTFLAFRTQGRLGCPKDYEVFSEALTPLLERMQGGVEHVGKVPASAGPAARQRAEIVALQRQLKLAIDHEDFERAADLRDRIREKEEPVGP